MKLTKVHGMRGGMRRIVWWFALAVLMMLPVGQYASAQGVSTTTVQGTVYLANGQPGEGTLVVSWPSFTTAAGQMITADQLTVTIPADGFVSVNLAPNLGATPAGEYYTATYYMSDGSTNTQYWVVPETTQATIAQVQAQVMPAVEAVQAVSKAYVDQSIAQLQQSQMTASGGTLTGPLTLSGDPTQPLQAADKHYVDSQVATAVPLSGGSMTGPLTLSSDPSQPMEAADKEYVDSSAANTWPAMVLRVDQLTGADFGAKLQACLGAVSAAYGGICDARNFTGNQVISTNVTISVANTTVLLPCATISTANQIVVTAGTRNVALRGCALRGGSTASASQGGTAFAYSGTGALIQVGDPTYAVDTVGFHLDNVVINTTAATSASTMGLVAYRTQELDIASVYFLGNANQTGMTLDGTGNYTGGTFLDDQFDGFQTALHAIGHQVANSATTDWMNASSFVRLHIDCPASNGNPIAGTYGINLLQGDGNTFTGGDVEGCATALHLGPNAQNNTIVGLRNENSTMQVVADAGSSYNDWITGGTMLAGQLTDNGTRNSFQDTFHRSFNGVNGDWYGSQQDATLTNHYRLGIGAGNERGLLDRYQTDYGYRWTTGLSDATTGEQFYEVLDELNNVDRLSIGQYNSGQSSTNNQTAINSAGTGAVALNGSNNAGTGGVLIGSGGPSATTVAAIGNTGNAQFNGTLQAGGAAQFAGTATVRNNANAEVDYDLWPGLTTSQKGSFIYTDWNGTNQWSMVKDASNNWALNSAVGGLDSLKAYQSANGGDTYVDASSSAGTVRINYETGTGAAFKVYGGNSSTLYASFTGTASIAFPGLAAASGHDCLQIDTSGNVTNTGSACGSGSGGSGTVGSSNAGYIAYYTSNGSSLGGISSVPVTAGGTGATTAAAALSSLGALPLAGGTLTGPLAAPAVNTVYDLKAKFGASGSNETMSCTATASSGVLTGCSGGDFVVGSTVFIPEAGVSSTVSAPSSITATCTSVDGASCTGSVVYGYEIVAVQGYPNGAMSPPSSPVTITQSAQSKLALAPWGLFPGVYTAVSWPSQTNAGLYLVYKSINGGPYNFYTILPTGTTSFNDAGSLASTVFTCSDIGVPCTVPSSGTPNDVYAVVTAVSGSSYTIAARSNQPQYFGSDGLSGGYPSIPLISGTVTVQHDDTPAFWAASSFLTANNSGGNVQLHIPSGTYNLHAGNATAGSGPNVLFANGLDNVTISGDGTSSFLYQSNDRLANNANFALGLSGQLNQSPSENVAEGYALSDPVGAGTNTVTLQTPSQASNLPAGTYVYMFADTAYPYPWSFYAELNLVTASSTTTGVVSLAYPTTKYYSASLIPPYSECASCAGAPYIMPVPGGIATRNLTFENFRYKGAAEFANLSMFDGVTMKNLDVLAATFSETGYSRHELIDGNKIHEDSYSYGGASGLLMGAAFDTDMTAINNTYLATHYMATGEQTCTEGAGNMVMRNNVMTWAGVGQNSNPISWADTEGAIDVVAPCVGFTFTNNQLTAVGTNMVNLPLIDAGQVVGATFAHNNIFVDSVGYNASASVGSLNAGAGSSNPYVNNYDNNWIVGSNTSGPVPAGGVSLAPFSTGTIASAGGAVSLYATYGLYTTTILHLSGNITSVNLNNGSNIQGNVFALEFVQPASGGPYTLPGSCSNSSWQTTSAPGGSSGGIICPGGIAPTLNPAAGSSTLLWFYDDGTNVFLTGTSYGGGTVSDGSGTTTAGQLAISTSAAHTIGYTNALPSGTTATTQSAGNNSNAVATTAYVASPGAIAPTTVTATGLVTGVNDTTLTSAATMTNSWTTTGLVLPTVPGSTTKAGRCIIYWRMSSTSYTATFGLGMSAAPTDVWGGSSVTYSASGTSNWLAFTQNTTSTTAVSTAATAAAANTTYRAEIDFTMETSNSTPVAMTLYGETSSASGTLTIEPGSTCYWLP